MTKSLSYQSTLFWEPTIFAKIRTAERLRVGRRGDPVAELLSTQLQITSAYAR